MNKPAYKRLKLRRKRIHRYYEIGQTIRSYQSWFNHDDIVTSWYKEGIIEKIEEAPVRGHHIWFRITKICCQGTIYNQSFMMNTLADFYSDSSYVFVLETPTQLRLPLETSKPWWNND